MLKKFAITADGDLLRGGTGQDIGSASATWDKVYANEFIGQINTVQQNITVNNLFVSGISTFVVLQHSVVLVLDLHPQISLQVIL